MCSSQSCLTQTAIPVAQDVDTMVNGTWGDIVTLQCPYRPGNYLSAYEVQWRTLLGGVTIVIDKDNVMEPFSLNQMDFTLSVELNPFSASLYRCRVAISSNSPGSFFLSGPIIYVSVGDAIGMLTIHQYF